MPPASTRAASPKRKKEVKQKENKGEAENIRKPQSAATLHDRFGNVLQTWDWKGRMVKIAKGAEKTAASRKEELASCVEMMERRVERLAAVLGDNFARGEALGAERAKQAREAMEMLEKEAAELKEKYTQESAACVQSVFRGNLARRKMRRAKAKYDAEIRTEGAKAIQNRFRGFMARREIRSARERMREAQKEGSAMVIQSAYRGRIARKKLRAAKSKKEKRYAAALRLQAWWRGCAGRLQFSNARKEYRDTLEAPRRSSCSQRGEEGSLVGGRQSSKRSARAIWRKLRLFWCRRTGAAIERGSGKSTREAHGRSGG